MNIVSDFYLSARAFANCQRSKAGRQVEGKGGGNNPDCQSKTMPGNDFFSIDGSPIYCNRIFAIVFSGNFK